MATDQSLTIVLLCSGSGADPSIYRPSRDDVRYRHRHDALVRCVATSLYGPASTSNGACELILLYDEDLSCMRMKLSMDSVHEASRAMMPPPPLEKDVIQLWKDAAKSAVRNKQHNASAGTVGTLNMNRTMTSEHALQSNAVAKLQAVCELDAWKKAASKSSGNKSNEINPSQDERSYANEATNMKRLPSQMPSSKREILTILQSTCPMEYLRQHHLNASIDVALRKANKTKLQKAWEGYAKYCSDQKADPTKTAPKRKSDDLNDNGKHDENWHRVEMTFRSILSEANGNSHSTIAAYLHESCDGELPCWGWDNLSRGKNGRQHIFLFLGAVRDMTSAENEALSIACKSSNIPLVPCRLGPVPEFTSKIVGVAGFHHFSGVLGDGLFELAKRHASEAKAPELPSKRRKLECKPPGVMLDRTIHNIAIVPMASASLTSDPDKRDRIHWCMVRMVVCSLWRSKLASLPSFNDGLLPLNNVLTFIFIDGSSVTLKQKDFTSAMAENHQAAPSEFQILEELCRQRDAINSSENDHNGARKKTCDQLVKYHVSEDKNKQFVLNMLPSKETMQGQKSLFHMAYSNEYQQNRSDGYTLFLIQCIDAGGSNVSSSSGKKVAKVRKHLLKAFRAANVVAMDHPALISSSMSCQEDETSTIVMLQHLDYQQRILSLLLEYDKKSSTLNKS